METTNKYAEATFGLVEAVFNKLGGMKGVKRFLRGDAEVVIKTYVIDCDVDPFIPDGWKFEEHVRGGELRWNPDEVVLWLCDQQKTGVIEGNELRKLLKGKLVLNANVLDYLLKNPQLIPDEWKGKYVFFWGTIYRDSHGRPHVRYLYWDGYRWDWSANSLGGGVGYNDPAILSCK